MVVFGTTRWHPGDDYHGWLTRSPITQGAFYLAFAIFGQNLETARMVSVTWFALFLVAFGIAYYRERSSPVFWAGLLMVGFQYVLWVISRTAIFEIAALSIFYAALLLLRRFSNAVTTNAMVIEAAKTKPFGFMPNLSGARPGRSLYSNRSILPYLESA
jgi:hypothetical protein